MMLVLLLGCVTLTESHCEFEVREIEDDKPLADLGASVEDVLLHLAEPVQVDAVAMNDRTLPVLMTIARGDGAALLDDATTITEVVGGSGPNTSNTWIGGDKECVDAVEVPVVLTIEGEGVSIAGNALLAMDFEGSEVVHALDVATESLPAGLHGAPVSGEVRVTYEGDALYEIAGTVVAEDGAREIVLWYRAY